MASHVRTTGALVQLVWSGSVLLLIPHNQEAKAILDAGFTADGAKIVVAIAQQDAGRDGYGQTSESFQTVKLTLS